MTRPWFQMYSRDWLDNKELRRCSPTARSVLADLMCLAHEGVPYGYLTDKVGPLTEAYMASRCVLSLTKFRSSVAELIEHGRLQRSVTVEQIFIARMVEDEALRLRRAAGGVKGGNPLLVGKVDSEVNLDTNLTDASEGYPHSRARTRADSVCVSDSFLDLESKTRKGKPLRAPGAVSQSFAAFWARWCEITKRKQRESYACQAWISMVEFDTESSAMACLERYGASDEVRRGIVSNPDKWIYDQAHDKFAGEWQPRDPTPPSGNTQQSRIRKALKEIELGETHGEIDGSSSSETSHYEAIQNAAIPRRGRRTQSFSPCAHGSCARCGVGGARGRRAA